MASVHSQSLAALARPFERCPAGSNLIFFPVYHLSVLIKTESEGQDSVKEDCSAALSFTFCPHFSLLTLMKVGEQVISCLSRSP